MFRRIAPFLATLTLAILLAASSVVSTVSMTPDRDREARAVVLSVFGSTELELCGQIDPHHEHRCPFCHQLPATQTAKVPEGISRLALHATPILQRDLLLRWQVARSTGFARAPPIVI
ncbi:hypothetical protein [Albirhodobacter sp. R86504]|uniref:hypothetical protein n=1 Tax=Albirhodobacter sp. R86504 TaxID=3093848 RepID=UPI00366F7378